MLIESIIFYLLLIDALIAALWSLSGKTSWWYQAVRPMARQFPLVKGWSVYYLVLVLFSGWVLYQSGNLVGF